MFCRYSLRTTDVDRGRQFYEAAIGLSLPAGTHPDASRLEAWPLHERARAQGVPAHWLGHLAVADVDASTNRLVELGAERLGPPVRTPDGTHYATLRDPTGAVVSVRSDHSGLTDDRVAWHQLHARDAERAWAVYSELFGLVHSQTVQLADPVGGHLLFAWRGGAQPVGSIANTARWPGVHCHWLFYFAVTDLEATVARVHALGGTAMQPVALADGRVLSACEDPQGAAFGLIQLP